MRKVNDNYACILIEDLEIFMRLGILPEEKAAAQRVLVNAELYVALDYLQGADEDTIVDYGAVVEKIQAWEDREHVDLLETLVQDLLDIAFSFDAVEAARVSVKKPDIIEQAQAVGLEVFQARLM